MKPPLCTGRVEVLTGAPALFLVQPSDQTVMTAPERQQKLEVPDDVPFFVRVGQATVPLREDVASVSVKLWGLWFVIVVSRASHSSPSLPEPGYS